MSGDISLDKYPQLVSFPSIGDANLGFISVAECGNNVPFDIKRVYWTYFTPNNVERGGHAHKQLEQLIYENFTCFRSRNIT